MVDTQADISVIKEKALNCNFVRSEIVRIKGVAGATSSIGTIETDLYFENFPMNHKFHVVSNEFDIPSDGILGKDFLKPNGCDISYKRMVLMVPVNEKDDCVFIPILQGPDQDTIVLPARSEVVRRFELPKAIGPQVINQETIDLGVYVARTIVNPKEPYVRIINTTS